MRVLLDTHVWLWWLSDDRALSARGSAVIEDPANEIFVSAISLWEVALKVGLGKLEVDVAELRASIELSGLRALSFEFGDAAEVAKLQPAHHDPFDRALVAQARRHGLRLLSADERLAAYGQPVMRLNEC